MNIGKINQTILIKRSLEKGKVRESEFEQYVAEWSSLGIKYHWFEFLKFDCKRGWDLITKALPEYIVDRIEYSIRKPAVLRKHKRQYLKAVKEDIKNHNYNRTDRYVLRIRNEVREFKQDMIDKNWRNKHVKNHISIHYGFSQIPKWLDQSDKIIKNKVKNWDKKVLYDIALVESAVRERRNQCISCVYCQCPLNRKWVKGSLGIRKPYVRLRTPLTQDDWATLAELKGIKPLRRQMKFDEEKFRQVQYAIQHNGIDDKPSYDIKNRKDPWYDLDSFYEMYGESK